MVSLEMQTVNFSHCGNFNGNRCFDYSVLSAFPALIFVKSILNPVRENSTAKRIAQGDFDARIQKKHNDEIGELCDTINEMAVELGNSQQMKMILFHPFSRTAYSPDSY